MNSLQPSARRRLVLSVVCLPVLAFWSGCQTYQQQTAEFTQSTKSGSLAASIATINKQAEANKGSKDEILWRLEQGATLRTAGLADPSMVPSIVEPAPAPKAGEPPAPPAAPPTAEEVSHYYLKRSADAFSIAEEKINTFEEQAKIKIGSELGAALTNQAALPYRGRTYDKVMMNTYKAINYLQLGSKDEARVELNRALQRQRDAVAENEKQIAAAQETAAQAKEGKVKTDDGKSASYDSDKAMNDAKTGPALQAALNESIAPMKPYGDYVNPFAVFVDGLFFTTLGENGSDWERGRKSLERVAAMVPENPYLKQDLDLGAAVAEGKPVENITYVIFETGGSPFRDQVRVDIPTFLVTSKLAYVGAAFPKLKYNNDYIGTLGITVGDQTFSTAVVASMDSVVANDFKNEWPTVVTKTLITTATKAIVQAAVQKQANDRGGMWGGLIAQVALTAVNSATNIADTRTWTSLPKEFQYARFATPADRQVKITAGSATETIALAPGLVNVVYVKSASTSAPLLVSQFAIK